VNVLGEQDDASPMEKILSFLVGEKSTVSKPVEKQFVTSIPVYPQQLNISIADNTGRKYVNTRIQIVLESSKSVYFETITDDKGTVILNENQLPIMPYFLFVVPTDNPPFEITTRDFPSLSVE
jgi:hypothetical protein